MRIIFAGIDGTGPLGNTAYQNQFRYSFVNRLYKRCPGPCHYQRGPAFHGMSTRERGHRAAQFVASKASKDEDADQKVLTVLAGYSRGGAAAIVAAQQMQRFGYAVDTLLLFDAVDRAVGVTAEVIPSNVKNCYHVMRHPWTNSRTWFKNCGTSVTKRTNFTWRYHYCTHGAMGGLPYGPGGANAQGFVQEPNDLEGTKVGAPTTTRVTWMADRATSYEIWTWMVRSLDNDIFRAKNPSLDYRERAMRGRSMMMPG